MDERIVTPEFRVAFPKVFEPDDNFNKTAKEYSLTMLFDKKTDITVIKKLINQAIVKKWPDEKTRPKELKKPVKDGDGEKWEGFDGCWAIRCVSKFQPGLVDEQVRPLITPSEFYGGCYARASLTAFAYSKGNNGVRLNLHNIQKLRDGEPFSKHEPPEADFGPPAGEANNPDNYTATDSDPWD